MLKRGRKGRIRIMALIIGAILIGIVIYIVVKVIQINNISIGKIIYIDFENGNADHLEMLLDPVNEKEPSNKLILFDREVIEKLIQYMRDKNIRIVPGEYKIPQTSSYKEIINILEFEAIQ